MAASDLLRPRYAVVPFVARGDLLDHAMRWREADTALDVLVLTGAGGFGKTRTAAEVCRAAEQSGWTAGLLDGDDDTTPLLTWRGRLLVAVDYAETRPEPVTDLLRRLLRRRSGPPVRVVLIVRQGGGRQSLIDLFATGDAADDVRLLLQRAELVGLGRGQRELDRRRLFATAATALAARLDVDATAPATAPDLYAEHFERPLIVLAAALLRVPDPQLRVAEMTLGQDCSPRSSTDRRPPTGNAATSGARSGCSPPRGAQWSRSPRCAGWPAGGPDDEQLIQLVPSLRETSPERAARIRQWLTDLYGPTGTLEPDLLAEVLIARVITDTPALVGAVLDGMPDPQLTRALVVLSRVAARSEPGRSRRSGTPWTIGYPPWSAEPHAPTSPTPPPRSPSPSGPGPSPAPSTPSTTSLCRPRTGATRHRDRPGRDRRSPHRPRARPRPGPAGTRHRPGPAGDDMVDHRPPRRGADPDRGSRRDPTPPRRPTLTRSLADLAASLNNQATCSAGPGDPPTG